MDINVGGEYEDKTGVVVVDTVCDVCGVCFTDEHGQTSSMSQGCFLHTFKEVKK